ncbi:MAG: hypothetical protein LKI38_10145 [Actinomyces sp.]|jgi:hypothetical protein|nr:hypothetical protein [Actinomyces sp.]MCI1642865.1 hypothetical protein [Actinomyces sp.]
MIRFHNVPITLVTLASAAVLLVSATTSAAAAPTTPSDPPSTDEGPTIIVGGQTLGPEQGLTIEEETYLETPGSDPVGYNPPAQAGTVTPMWVEGPSFAYSTESATEIEYVGRGRAGGNISNGKRIVRVCFWWTQDQRRSLTYCGDAAFDGRYSPGPEFVGSFRDTLNPVAPKTYFHVQVSRIDPNF